MATEWSFPVVTLPANPHRALPVFAIPPNWKTGVTETLAWETDVMSSETAVEQRRSLRRFPRRSFEYAFMRQGTARARIDNFLAGVGKRDCLVPIWHEQVPLGVPNSGGLVQFPSGSLAMREFAVDDLVLVTNMDADRWALLTVATVNLLDDEIELVSLANVGTWARGSRIVPIRRAKMLDSVTLENVSDRVGSTRMRFMLQDADERFTPSWGYCAPLWRIKPDRSTPITMNFNRSDYTLDFGSGVIDVTDPGDRAQISQSMSIKLFGRPQVWGFRSLLYNARGRARRFYVPTYVNDIETVGDIDGPDFDAKPNGLSDYFLGPQDARKIIGIFFKDGRPTLYRTIMGIASMPGTTAPFRPDAERVTLDADLPPILKREIDRISFVVPSRFDQDTIELFHAVSDCAALSASVVTRSSSLENMPPIECLVTSRPYPVVASESIETQTIVVSGSLYIGIAYATESMISSVTVVSGQIIQTKAPIVLQPTVETMQGDLQLVSGQLIEVLVTLNPSPEMLSGAIQLMGGTLDTVVITYNLDIENISSELTLIGGTLS